MNNLTPQDDNYCFVYDWQDTDVNSGRKLLRIVFTATIARCFITLSVKASCPRIFQITVHKRHCLRFLDSDLCWVYILRLHSTVPLCLHDPLPTVHKHREVLWGPRKRPPGCLRLCSTGASVSQSAHNTTLLLLQLAAFPSPSPTAASLSTREKPTHLRGKCQHGLWSDSSYSLSISVLLSFSLSRLYPSSGPGPLRANVWWSTVNMCEEHMCEMDQDLSTFFLPVAWLKQRDFHCVRRKLCG